MSGTFNGYHVWLGIPPAEQPPNHYRLLGIAEFEDDLDVIDHAADRQVAHVRTFQSGKHGALSQQILNELEAARLCLLKPEKKAAYDDLLKGKSSSSSAANSEPLTLAPIDDEPRDVVPMVAIPRGSVPQGVALPQGVAVPVVTPSGLTKPPVAAVIPRATPVVQAKAKGAGSITPTTLEDDLAMELDRHRAAKAQELTIPIRAYRRKRKGDDWKSAAALGVLAGGLAIGGFLFFSVDWSKLFSNNAAPPAAESTAPAADKSRPSGNPAAPQPATPAGGATPAGSATQP